ncbi:hypothetical protein [Hyphomicrobium sp. NDB2Meth4]|uniref:hypothetical protein n=1 Tax=Hyphomicrobium sp. NDB2Meth4 TaxID=1892846 RepID=UPI0009302893|nr:hypothetical protein [Hyphomicrobium sp. NDB2Meth4]
MLSTDALAASLAPTVEQPSRSQLATQFVGVIFGELFARLQPSIRASRPTLAGATSTLAYAIARACLGLVPFGVEETISRWHFARSVVGSAQSPRIDDSVIAVCREIVGSALWRSPKGSSQLSFLTGDKSPAAPPIETLLASEGQPEFAKIDTLPAEERVRVADRVLASILASGVPPPVQAQAAAIVVRRAVHGYFAQRRLIEPFLNRLPEASVWLGAAQKDTAPPELFGTEDGLGWRILGRTEENVDIFSRPQCDVSVDELRTYVNRSRADLPGSTTRSIVEVAPGVNLAILKAATEIPSKRSSKRVDPRKDALDAAADSLKQAMAALAELRKRERR